MLFTEQQHLCKAVLVARKQFQLSGTHARSLHLKPLQYFFERENLSGEWLGFEEKVLIGVDWTKPMGGTLSPLLFTSLPQSFPIHWTLPPSLDLDGLGYNVEMR